MNSLRSLFDLSLVSIASPHRPASFSSLYVSLAFSLSLFLSLPRSLALRLVLAAHVSSHSVLGTEKGIGTLTVRAPLPALPPHPPHVGSLREKPFAQG
jgi:hypothetical protein